MAAVDAGFPEGTPDRTRVAFVYLGDGVEEVAEEVDDTWLVSARERLDELVTGAASGVRNPRPSEACRSCDFSRFCEPGRAWMAGQNPADPG